MGQRRRRETCDAVGAIGAHYGFRISARRFRGVGNDLRRSGFIFKEAKEDTHLGFLQPASPLMLKNIRAKNGEKVSRPSLESRVRYEREKRWLTVIQNATGKTAKS